jgi:hypothetical protein
MPLRSPDAQDFGRSGQAAEGEGLGHVERLRYRYLRAAEIGFTEAWFEQAHEEGYRAREHDARPKTQDRAVTDQIQSFGERAVGLTFNPSGDPLVGELKKLCAFFIDQCNEARMEATDHEVKRMYSVAITEAQTAQMWAVKAATWR